MNKFALFSVVMLFLFGFAAQNADAKICFAVDKDCEQDKVGYTACVGKLSLFPYNKSECKKENEKYVPQGAYCYSGDKNIEDRDHYAACDCDKTYIYDVIKVIEGNGKYEYKDTVTCKNRLQLAKHRICAARYKYAEESAKGLYNSKVHNPLTFCGAGLSPDDSGDYCEEQDSVLGGGTSYKRYESCSCSDSFAKSQGWTTCTGAGTSPGTYKCSAGNTKYYASCGCQYGYSKQGDRCVANSGGNCNTGYIMVNGSCVRCNQNNFVCQSGKVADYNTCQCLTQQVESRNFIWLISSDFDIDFDENAKKAIEGFKESTDTEIKYVTISPSDFNNYLNTALASGMFDGIQISRVYSLGIHPLVSIDMDSSEWGLDFGISPLKPYRDFDFEDDSDLFSDFNIPFFAIGKVSDAREYQKYCRTTEDETENSMEYNWFGWLGGMDYIGEEDAWTNKGKGLNLSEGPVQTGHIRMSESNAMGCHPSQVSGDRYDEYGQTSTPIEYFGLDELWGYGGDQCLNYMFMINGGAQMPGAVFDRDNGYLYIIDSRKAYNVGAVSEGDWPTNENGSFYSNFLTWWNSNTEEERAGICKITKEQAQWFRPGNLLTYPWASDIWQSVVKGEITEEEARDYIIAPDEDAGTHFSELYIGDEYVDLYKEQVDSLDDDMKSRIEDYFKRRYYQSNVRNLKNGLYNWSYPFDYSFDEDYGNGEYDWDTGWDDFIGRI